jgi:hypothetical protein
MKRKPKGATTIDKPKKKALPKGGKKLPPKVKIERKSKAVDMTKYIKISSNESSEKFKELGDRVQRKELKWAYFATENSIGMHYYLILNVNK